MNSMKAPASPTVSTATFGQMPDGRSIEFFTLQNQSGMSVKIITYGAIIAECWVPDQEGKKANVVLGFDKLEPYLAKHPRFGSTIGRYANRIANAQFELDGKTYKIAANKGSSSIHGGNVGFDKRVWTAADHGSDELKAWVTLTYFSPDMEEGYPGNLKVSITFSLASDNSLTIDYSAESDKATPINLTNHSYFNLQGAGNGTILNHEARLNAKTYTPLNENLVPTGDIVSVENSPYDFSKQTPIGQRIAAAGGYDLNYIIDRIPADAEGAASITDPASGRSLTVFTDQPAFQFFTANSLDGSIIGNGGSYQQYAGFCIETQQYPNSVNQANFPNTILRPPQKFRSTTKFLFKF